VGASGQGFAKDGNAFGLIGFGGPKIMFRGGNDRPTYHFCRLPTYSTPVWLECCLILVHRTVFRTSLAASCGEVGFWPLRCEGISRQSQRTGPSSIPGGCCKPKVKTASYLTTELVRSCSCQLSCQSTHEWRRQSTPSSEVPSASCSCSLQGGLSFWFYGRLAYSE
jgi:hypothetical protein